MGGADPNGLLIIDTRLATVSAAADSLWQLLTSFFVLLTVLLGRSFLEAGHVRATCIMSTAYRNLAACAIAGMSWWTLGCRLATAADYADTGATFIGDFGSDEGPKSFLMFTHAAIGACIVSSAVSGRITLLGYYALVVVASVIVLPVSMHWVWQGRPGSSEGWLRSLGVVDAAGALVVNASAGVMGMSAAAVLGPRTSQSTRGGEKSSVQDRQKLLFNIPHNKFLQVVGVQFIWCGWLCLAGGFGSISREPITIMRSIAIVCASGSVAAIIGSSHSFLVHGYYRTEDACFSVLSGLVTASGACTVVSFPWAFALGAISPFARVYTDQFFGWLGIDDVVGVGSLHFVCGAIGTLAVALADSDSIRSALARETYDSSRWRQLGVQLLALVSVSLWSLLWTLAVCSVLKKFGHLRLSPEDERRGLDHVFFKSIANTDSIVAAVEELAQEATHNGLDETCSSDHTTHDDEGMQLLVKVPRTKSRGSKASTSDDDDAMPRGNFKAISLDDIVIEGLARYRRRAQGATTGSATSHASPRQEGLSPRPGCRSSQSLTSVTSQCVASELTAMRQRSTTQTQATSSREKDATGAVITPPTSEQDRVLPIAPVEQVVSPLVRPMGESPCLQLMEAGSATTDVSCWDDDLTAEAAVDVRVAAAAAFPRDTAVPIAVPLVQMPSKRRLHVRWEACTENLAAQAECASEVSDHAKRASWLDLESMSSGTAPAALSAGISPRLRGPSWLDTESDATHPLSQ